MEEDKKDKRSDFAERVREWEAKNPEEVKRMHRREAFVSAIGAFIAQNDPFRDASYGEHRDELGGELLYVYLRPHKETAIRLGRGFRKKDISEVGKVMPDVLEDYFDRIPQAMSSALESLLQTILQSSIGSWRPIDIHGKFKPARLLPLHEVNIEYDSGKGRTEITRFPKQHGGHKKPKLTPEEHIALDSRFEQLETVCENIKDHHNQEFQRFKENNSQRGFRSEQWCRTWIAFASEVYPQHEANVLALFADPDNYARSTSEIAYKMLSQETGHAVAYLKKLVSKSRIAQNRSRRTSRKKRLKDI
ncbi:MAG TPA: hypothetical protein VGO91_10745 [Pyrinomonadaceae bacterium]|jgi:hypothetical protein|nr:hypothetical protein [Pyrinomonadaceae bacterium]